MTTTPRYRWTDTYFLAKVRNFMLKVTGAKRALYVEYHVSNTAIAIIKNYIKELN